MRKQKDKGQALLYVVIRRVRGGDFAGRFPD